MESALILLLLCFVLDVSAVTDKTPEFAARAIQLEKELKQDSLALIDHVNEVLKCAPGEDLECIKADPEVKKGVNKFIEKLEEFGEMKARTEREIKYMSYDEVKAVWKKQLHETSYEIKCILAYTGGVRTRQLFAMLVEAAKEESDKLL